jgi:hypothetical protein
MLLIIIILNLPLFQLEVYFDPLFHNIHRTD